MKFDNPFRPGAGHKPPYLAGRDRERRDFESSLTVPVLRNIVISGLRGIGKTVLLESLRPIANSADWAWVGSELSESVFVSEQTLATRLLADLATFSSTVPVPAAGPIFGFSTEPDQQDKRATFDVLRDIYDRVPGLVVDKIKGVIETVWKWNQQAEATRGKRTAGIVFSYDEAQNITDQRERSEFPLSVLLDAFQALQKGGVPVFLVLAGLPTLLPKLVEARAYSERMFHVIALERLSEVDTIQAIEKPLEDGGCPVRFSEESKRAIWRLSGGYPYFIQFICRDTFDVWIRDSLAPVPVLSIQQKLDADFFYGRWSRATDRQRELLALIASLPEPTEEFTTAEIVSQSNRSKFKPLSTSNATQLLAAVCELGLVFKNRHGRYVLGVPLLDAFIRRQPIFEGAAHAVLPLPNVSATPTGP